MYSNKGFSLIELITIVGIIGILSLLALPVYQDYITKVKLTEVALKHVYLTRQIEIDYSSEGHLAVYGLLRGMCATGITESINGTGRTLQCTTDDNRSLVVTAAVGNVTIGLYPDMSTFNDPKLEFTLQSFYLTDNVYEAAIQYSFADKPIKGSIRDL